LKPPAFFDFKSAASEIKKSGGQKKDKEKKKRKEKPKKRKT
jgi:hypothetical protein